MLPCLLPPPLAAGRKPVDLVKLPCMLLLGKPLAHSQCHYMVIPRPAPPFPRNDVDAAPRRDDQHLAPVSPSALPVGSPDIDQVALLQPSHRFIFILHLEPHQWTEPLLQPAARIGDPF